MIHDAARERALTHVARLCYGQCIVRHAARSKKQKSREYEPGNPENHNAFGFQVWLCTVPSRLRAQEELISALPPSFRVDASRAAMPSEVRSRQGKRCCWDLSKTDRNLQYKGPALGFLPGAVNAQVGQARNAASVPTAAGQENTPVALPSAKPASKKRKSTEAHVPVTTTVDFNSGDLKDALMDENCDHVRRRINGLFDSGAMSKTAFAREIGVSAKSLNEFLGQDGPFSGAGCYGAAWQYFKKSEGAGVKLSVKKQKINPVGEMVPKAAAAAGPKAVAAAAAAAFDVSGIVLPGEEYDDVPVYDNCDEIRRKINAHLKKPGATQAQLCRDMSAQLHGFDRPSKGLQSSQLATFRKGKGATSGAKSSVFYGAYVFFEKLRIKDGKAKSKHRLAMEEEWGSSGMDRTIDDRSK